ncbi:hypothetical protein M917_2001 [Psychrobacter aquaticus CMS 56]|uniref:Uncharacterized protein n=1 Tax=Psychrobacter aquaticus CMS 56 TaxID=1354303 RepID=U4T9W0_9GAMM|nr:hypothetical protein M917_2001 [Psychrobacter aquaticus CMS 56]
MFFKRMMKLYSKVAILLLSVSMASAFAANNDVDNNTAGSKMTIAISQGEIKGEVDNDVTAFYL